MPVPSGFDHLFDDRRDSDDLADILEVSKMDWSASQAQPAPPPTAKLRAISNGRGAISAPHASTSTSTTTDAGESSYRHHQALHGKIAKLDDEIKSVREDIGRLRDLEAVLQTERKDLVSQTKKDATPARKYEGKGKEKVVGGEAGQPIDYTSPKDWDKPLKEKMRRVFGIQSFRMCQQGVCNANLDRRDIVCVMPTGGGKSLTYQLPALLADGCTLVISPLVSLMTDQILHLKDNEVEAVMLTGSTPKSERNDIERRLKAMAYGQLPSGEKEIKLCYVTPEKIAKSNTFRSILNSLYQGGVLARFVIDEAHCVSQLGHDFRTDYKDLSVLRKLCPNVPILALSATCPPQVREDLRETLGMERFVPGNASPPTGTVFFSAPLYRKNLHYSVLPKSPQGKTVIQDIAKYIRKYHAGQSGIIYCLSKKDTENVSKQLKEDSGGAIKTGVYHSEVQDRAKEELHKDWRTGKIQVVCATIAFGMGIDKGDVRFVIHHSLPKSVDGYYQETGRAGRDGDDADCVLYYRPQDAVTLSSFVLRDRSGEKKLHDMLKFAQDLRKCRKIFFARYFAASANLSIDSWTTDETDANERCGHCDNCTRPPESFEVKSLSIECWILLRVVETIEAQGGRVTIGQLATLGRNGGKFATSNSQGKRKRSNGEAVLDLAELGGKVSLSPINTETLIVELLLSGYLREKPVQTSYSVNTYVTSSQMSIRFTRYSKEEVEAGKAPSVECSFVTGGRKLLAASKQAAKATSKVSANKVEASRKQRRQLPRPDSFDEDEPQDLYDSDDSEDVFIVPDDEVQFEPMRGPSSTLVASESDLELPDSGWQMQQRPPKKRRKANLDEAEILEISSD